MSKRKIIRVILYLIQFGLFLGVLFYSYKSPNTYKIILNDNLLSCLFGFLICSILKVFVRKEDVSYEN